LSLEFELELSRLLLIWGMCIKHYTNEDELEGLDK